MPVFYASVGFVVALVLLVISWGQVLRDDPRLTLATINTGVAFLVTSTSGIYLGVTLMTVSLGVLAYVVLFVCLGLSIVALLSLGLIGWMQFYE